MFAGHAAIALAIKAREPRVAIIPLLLACSGPDWLEVLLMLPRPREGMAVFTHSIPAVVVGAVLAALLYRVLGGREGWRWIAWGWLLHWPADLITGRKPIIFVEPLIGLDLYYVPVADFLIESSLIALASYWYARRYATTGRQRRLVWVMATVLTLLQFLGDYVLMKVPGREWRYALAGPLFGAHLPGAGAARPPVTFRTGLAPVALVNNHERHMAAREPDEIVTLVCITCGKQQFFTEEVPAALTCTQCAGTVFRTFDTPTRPDEAAIDALEEQARGMAQGDSSPDAMRPDVRDLGLR